jgi:hypothetical protein
MADPDLERIITDLRARRANLDQSIQETSAGSAEREQLVLAAGKLRERIAGLAERVVGRRTDLPASPEPPGITAEAQRAQSHAEKPG